jgi:hypothetical protein
MKTQHVPSDQWRRTLDDLSRAYDGAIVSLEIVGNDVGAQPHAGAHEERRLATPDDSAPASLIDRRLHENIQSATHAMP